jgi:hypothetical protein
MGTRLVAAQDHADAERQERPAPGVGHETDAKNYLGLPRSASD